MSTADRETVAVDKSTIGDADIATAARKKGLAADLLISLFRCQPRERVTEGAVRSLGQLHVESVPSVLPCPLGIVGPSSPT